MSLRLAALAAPLLTLVLAATASAELTPKSCGQTYNGRYDVRVSQPTSCSFADRTYRAIQAFDRAHEGFFCAACEHNFRIRVSNGKRNVRMDCRDLTRAHGELDFHCNNINYRGNKIVKLINATLP
jgi:hypothetical protein